jgi:hypothetical protein
MHKRLASMTVAVLLAGAGAAMLSHFASFLPGKGTPVRTDEFAIANGRSAMVGCREAAQMTFDVHWAAACQAQAGDGHAECDLPDTKAAVINAWLNEAERRCAAEGRSP